jgi:hypothetical protein
MAKKHRQSNINKIESIVSILYYRGVWHSLIVHTVLFLILAMMFPSEVHKQKIQLTLHFTSTEETTEPDLETFEDHPIKIVSLEESKDSLESTSQKIGLDTVSLLEDSVEIPSIAIPDTGIEKQVDLIDSINTADLAQEIKQPSNKEEKKIEYTGRTNQVLLSRRGIAQQQSVPNIMEQTQVGEMQKRLQQYGAKTGDVQISLSWDTIDDLDLYVLVKPIGSDINWTNRVGICGGALDIDMNAHPRLLNQRPIENIFWARGNAPFAEYVVGVHFFMNWSRAQQIRGILVIKVDGETKSFPVIVKYGDPVTRITTFTRQR